MWKKYSWIFMMMFLVGCSPEAQHESWSPEQFKNVVQAYGDRELASEAASITGEALWITEEGEQLEIPIPTDEFFVSIAPYRTVTHDCEIHSLTGCQGELVHETFTVTVIDEKGDIVNQDNYSTGVNGFIDLWLPRDQTLQVFIESGEERVEAELTTYSDSPTCITTMQLQKS